MSFALEDDPAARAEYLDAVDYYDRQRPGLGDELIDRFEEALRDIAKDPGAWPRVDGWEGDPVLRNHRVETFHYRVVYYVAGDHVRIVAYAHTSRMPGYWSDRTRA